MAEVHFGRLIRMEVNRPKKGGFLSRGPGHMAASVWARAEPSQNYLPPSARPKSRLYRDFHLYLKIH